MTLRIGHMFLALGTALAVGACEAKDPPAGTPAPPTAEAQCGAAKVQGYLGQKETEPLLAEIGKAANPGTMRVIRPGSAVTMDYRPDRLDIETNLDRRITRLRCG